MHVRTFIPAALAAAAIASAVMVAPASAQSPLEPKEPRNAPPVLIVPVLLSKLSCAFAGNVPDTANCGFENAVWALNVGEAFVRTGQDTFNREYEVIRQQVEAGLVAVDDAQKLVVGKACEVLGIPPDDCPQV